MLVEHRTVRPLHAEVQGRTLWGEPRIDDSILVRLRCQLFYGYHCPFLKLSRKQRGVTGAKSKAQEAVGYLVAATGFYEVLKSVERQSQVTACVESR